MLCGMYRKASSTSVLSGVPSGTYTGGKRVIVAGTGPLLLAVAAYLKSRGAVIPLTSEKAFVRFVDRGDEAPLLDAPPTNRYGAPPARAFDPGEF